MSIQHILVGAAIAGTAVAGASAAHNTEQRSIAAERVVPCGMQPSSATYCVDIKALARALGKTPATESQDAKIEQLEAQIASLEGQIAILQMRR